MHITSHKAVSIDYTLTNGAGEVLDTSRGREPMAYIHGIGALIPGLEKAIEGKAVGDHIHVTIEPEDAYGLRNEALVQIAPREAFEGVDELEVGMSFHASGDGGPQTIVITGIEGDEITVDANHPLAGMQLHFDIDVVNVRDASKEELEHGHIHGPGGHEH